MMTAEICITCGCGEFSHYRRACDERCPEDCGGESDDHNECECGDCDDYRWLESVDPDQLVCSECGNGCLGDDMNDCGCDGEREDITAARYVLQALENRGRPRVREGLLEVEWLDEPVRVVGALVADDDGLPVRVEGVPHDKADVFLYFAVSDDGMELAITSEDL
jgi:hypothetical protein